MKLFGRYRKEDETFPDFVQSVRKAAAQAFENVCRRNGLAIATDFMKWYTDE
jgi:hypothetical protein